MASTQDLHQPAVRMGKTSALKSRTRRWWRTPTTAGAIQEAVILKSVRERKVGEVGEVTSTGESGPHRTERHPARPPSCVSRGHNLTPRGQTLHCSLRTPLLNAYVGWKTASHALKRKKRFPEVYNGTFSPQAILPLLPNRTRRVSMYGGPNPGIKTSTIYHYAQCPFFVFVFIPPITTTLA